MISPEGAVHRGNVTRALHLPKPESQAKCGLKDNPHHEQIGQSGRIMSSEGKLLAVYIVPSGIYRQYVGSRPRLPCGAVTITGLVNRDMRS